MNKKIVFFDIDGTLYDNHNKVIPTSAIDAIKKLRENDIVVAIATGRSPLFYKDVLVDIMPYINAYITINGQYIIFNDEVLYDNPIDIETIDAIISKCQDTKIDYGFLSHDKCMVSNQSDEAIKAFDYINLKIPDVDLEFHKNNPVHQIMVFGDDAIDILKDEFTDLTYFKWHENGGDICSKGISKARGIEILCKKVGINIADSVAFGDADNDIDMINVVGTGVAMGNSNNAVKKVADMVTDDVDKDGIYKGLKNLKLI